MKSVRHHAEDMKDGSMNSTIFGSVFVFDGEKREEIIRKHT
jgi:hypothetical protein